MPCNAHLFMGRQLPPSEALIPATATDATKKGKERKGKGRGGSVVRHGIHEMPSLLLLSMSDGVSAEGGRSKME